MSQQYINVGASANDGLGDPIRTAFQKTNENFSQLFAGNGGGGNLTVSNWSTGNVISNTITNVEFLRFNANTGITVSNIGNNSALVSLGSSFKTWEVAGQGNLVAVGEDVVQFVAGSGITITTNPNVVPQQIQISSAGSGGTTDWANIGNITNSNGPTQIAIGQGVALPTAPPGQFNSVVYANGQYVAVGVDSANFGLVIHSSDGITWNTATGNFYNITFTSVIWDEANYVVVGYSNDVTNSYLIVFASTDAITWTQAGFTSYFGNSRVSSIAYNNNGTYVIVGQAPDSTALILTSDLYNFFPQETGVFTNTGLLSVVWNGTQFVAVGDAGGGTDFGIILTSPDGVTWTQQATNTYGVLISIIWSGTQFVAVGYNIQPIESIILTSPDGVTWTQQAVGLFSGAAIFSIAYNGSDQYVALGIDIAAGFANLILTSPDGVTWTQQTNNQDTYIPLSVVYGGGQYMSVGGVGLGSNPNTTAVYSSPDGIVWSRQYLLVQGANAIAIGAYAGAYGDNSIVLNATGSALTGSANTFTVSPIRYDPNVPSLLGPQSGIGLLYYNPLTAEITVSTTPDIPWANIGNITNSSGPTEIAIGQNVNQPTGLAPGSLNNITIGNTYGGSSYYYVTVGGGVVPLALNSNTGYSNWTNTFDPTFRGVMSSVIWDGIQYVITGYGDGYTYNLVIFTSSNMTEWTEQPVATVINAQGYTSLAYDGTTYVLVGYLANIWTSTDLLNWTQQISLPSSYNLRDIIWTGTQFVTVGDNANGSGDRPEVLIYTSPNGITWTQQEIGVFTNSSLYNVIWDGAQFVAVGALPDNGTIGYAGILTSPDGVNWTQRATGLFVDVILKSITYNGSNQYVAVGAFYSGGSVILTSLDAITWTQTFTYPGVFDEGDDGLLSIVYNPNTENGGNQEYVAVGFNYDTNTTLSFYSYDGIDWTQLFYTTNSIPNTVAIGNSVGGAQGDDAVAVGNNAGNSFQSNKAIAIGNAAGFTSQGISSIAIGNSAGHYIQGNLAIAIGDKAGYFYQAPSTIEINATGAPLNVVSGQANRFYVAPVRNDTGNTNNALYYNTSTNEITYTTPASLNSSLAITVDNGTSAVTTGNKTFITIPYNCTITGWSLLSDTSGNLSITISTSTVGTFPTLTTISGVTPPELSNSQVASNYSLTDWSTALTAGEILVATVTGTPTVNLATLTLSLLQS